MEPQLEVDDPWWTHLRIGTKTVEGRKRSILRKILKLAHDAKLDLIDPQKAIGSRVSFCLKGRPLCFLARIIAVRSYADLNEYLDGEGLDRTLPGIVTREGAISVYNGCFTAEQISEVTEGDGMVALEIQVLS